MLPPLTNHGGVPATNSGSYQKLVHHKLRWFAAVLGVLVIVAFPYIHLGIAYRGWNDGKKEVDKYRCTCECWDTYFKGSYEAGIAGYKHIYFNLTSQVFRVWAITVVTIIASYEVFRRLILLATQQQLRRSMLALFLSVIYSHYYAWWMYFNYYNDDYYTQFYHQTLYTVTELISTGIVLHFCDKLNSIKPRGLLIILGTATAHIVTSGADQFVVNVFFGHGEWFQTWRDIGFIIPDILHIIVSVALLKQYATISGISLKHVFELHDILITLGCMIFFYVIVRMMPN